MKFTVLEAIKDSDGGLVITLEQENFSHADGSPHAVVITVPASIIEALAEQEQQQVQQ